MEEGVRGRKHNRRIRELFGESDIVWGIRGSRLRWAGHTLRKKHRKNTKNYLGNFT